MRFGRIFIFGFFTLIAFGLHRIGHADPIFPTETYCGDGVINVTGETCDDGNNVDGDGCDHLCHEELKPIFPTETYCGDGVINDKGEACDDGNNVDGDGCDHLCQVEAKPTAPAPALPEAAVERTSNDETTAAIVSGIASAQQDNVDSNPASKTGGWSCSMVDATHTSSPWTYGGALLLLLAGAPSLRRKKY